MSDRPKRGSNACCRSPLPDRVVGEHDESAPRQVDREQLSCRLARVPVPHRHQNRGMPAWPIRPVQVRRDDVVGEAVEHHVLDHVSVARRGLRDARPKRPAIVRQPSNQGQHLLSHRLLAGLCSGGVLDPGDDVGTRPQLPLRDRVERRQKRRRRLRPHRDDCRKTDCHHQPTQGTGFCHGDPSICRCKTAGRAPILPTFRKASKAFYRSYVGDRGRAG